MRGIGMKKGIFITFEGNDGSGKTTISTMIFNELQKQKYPVVYTREPGGIEIAEQIRNLILNPEYTNMDARTEALLYAASRRQHLVEKILPALEEGKIVLCDRFIDSSLVYQGEGRGIGIDEVYRMNEFAIQGHMPHKTIFLSIPVEEGLKRVQTRGAQDRLDKESLTFHQAVAKGYEIINEQNKERIHYVDATQSIEDVFKDTLHIIEEFINEYNNI